jgi:PAS domain S-box-containing protein
VIDGFASVATVFILGLVSKAAEPAVRRIPRSMIVGLLLLVLLLAGVYSFVSLSNANAWLRHTDEVRVRIALLRGTLLDAETGLRGYLFTGSEPFLDPYRAARASWRGQLDEVRALTSDNPDQQNLLHGLEALIAGDFDGFSEARAAAERPRAALAPVPLMQEHKRRMDAARVVLTNMEDEEARLDELREHAATRRWGFTAVVLISGGFFLLVLIALMMLQRRFAEMQRGRADEERRLLQAMFAGIDDGIILFDRSGKLIFANVSAARMIGFPSAEALLGAPAPAIAARFELQDEDGQPFPIGNLPSRLVLAGKPAAQALIRHRSAGSSPWRWSLVNATPITDDAGAIVQAVSVFRDVTAERVAEERQRFLLRASDELGSSLDYERTLAAVARLAVPALADWCAVDIVENDQVKRLATAHVDPGKVSFVAELTHRYPPDPTSRTGIREIIRTGQPQLISEIPRELLTAAAVDEEHLRLIQALELRSFIGVPLSVSGRTLGAISFVMAESHRVYGEDDLAFARALADRAALAIENARLFREVEQARAATAAQLVDEEQRRRVAEEQARFAETFVGMLGHDLRNPLNAILMTARLLRRRATSAADLGAIDRVQASAQRMSNMVGQLLDLTRSRIAGGITVERRATDLSGVVSEVVDELKRAYPGRSITWNADPGVLAYVDRDRLAQVISNLVGNALEHGDVTRPVTVRLTPGDDDAILLSVHNDGPPIAPDLLPSLFEPFRRSVVRNERSKGLGLGLYITVQIVQAHSGRLEVASTTERGTTFTVVLPRLAVGEGQIDEEQIDEEQIDEEQIDEEQIDTPRRHLIS